MLNLLTYSMLYCLKFIFIKYNYDVEKSSFYQLCIMHKRYDCSYNGWLTP